ncbi:MAG: hypothetical protein HRU18_03140 [Pseudoalteromonas sp.]|uniref:hypothetical protein n=1 Tax=Pseudoalteromonas sp. TaxID=53249 RepID=UPI001DA15055|nr:hypothetical protein [Pseudoalteromonas sp.]NRA77180.1 hypothetical protein [Pseudoalteromonas sp.]
MTEEFKLERVPQLTWASPILSTNRLRYSDYASISLLAKDAIADINKYVVILTLNIFKSNRYTYMFLCDDLRSLGDELTRYSYTGDHIIVINGISCTIKTIPETIKRFELLEFLDA